MPTWPDKNKKPLAFTAVLKGPGEAANLADCKGDVKVALILKKEGL